MHFFDDLDSGTLIADLAAIGRNLTALTLDWVLPELAYGLIDQSPLLVNLDVGSGLEGRLDVQTLCLREVVKRLHHKNILEVLVLDSFPISPSIIDDLRNLPPTLIELDLSRMQPLQPLDWVYIRQFFIDENWLPRLLYFDCSLLNPFDAELEEELLYDRFDVEGVWSTEEACEARGVAVPNLFRLVERGALQTPLFWRVEERCECGGREHDAHCDVGSISSDDDIVNIGHGREDSSDRLEMKGDDGTSSFEARSRDDSVSKDVRITEDLHDSVSRASSSESSTAFATENLAAFDRGCTYDVGAWLAKAEDDAHASLAYDGSSEGSGEDAFSTSGYSYEGEESSEEGSNEEEAVDFSYDTPSSQNSFIHYQEAGYQAAGSEEEKSVEKHEYPRGTTPDTPGRGA